VQCCLPEGQMGALCQGCTLRSGEKGRVSPHYLSATRAHAFLWLSFLHLPVFSSAHPDLPPFPLSLFILWSVLIASPGHPQQITPLENGRITKITIVKICLYFTWFVKCKNRCNYFISSGDTVPPEFRQAIPRGAVLGCSQTHAAKEALEIQKEQTALISIFPPPVRDKAADVTKERTGEGK